jgi:single-strand DNA-binding protein
MAGTLNKVMLIGHLGDEIKMHYFDGGNAIGRFPIATNETYTNRQTGEKVTTTEWHNIVVKNKLAQICEKYLTKGDKVYVEGKIKTRQWEGQDGVKRYSTEIHVTDMTFLSDKKGQQSGSETETSQQQAQTGNTPAAEPPPQSDDDLPF